MARVRYEKTSTPNIVQSSRVIFHPTNGAQYRIQLNTEDIKWSVLDYASNKPVLGGDAVSLSRAKIAVKRALEKLGIYMEVETRAKRNAS